MAGIQAVPDWKKTEIGEYVWVQHGSKGKRIMARCVARIETVGEYLLHVRMKDDGLWVECINVPMKDVKGPVASPAEEYRVYNSWPPCQLCGLSKLY